MAVSDWPTAVSTSMTIEGINIGENCPSGNMNDVTRAMAVAIKNFSLTVPSTANFMPKSGGTFTGQILRQGAGGYLYNANSAQSGGAVYIQPVSAPLPSNPAEGTIVFQY